VAVENAPRPNEAHIHATLATVADLLEADRPNGPTLVLIGAVVALSRAIEKPARLAT
jgi:siroheme synthase